MIEMMRSLLPRVARRPMIRYLLATAVYAIAEGAAFGIFTLLLFALLAGETSIATEYLLPLLAVVAVGWFAQYDMGMQALRLASMWRRDLHERLEAHLIRLPLGWFDGTATGRVSQLINADVGRVVGTVFRAQAVIGAVLTPATILVFLIALDWRVAIAACLCIPAVLLVFWLARRLGDRAEAAHDAATAEAGSRLVEFARSQPVLRATATDESGLQLLHTALTDQYTAARRQVVSSLPGQYLGQVAIQLAFTSVLVTGLALVVADGMTVPRMLSLVVLGICLLRPFEVIAGAATTLRTTVASVRRINAVFATNPLPAPDHATPLGPPSIELADVHFGYDAHHPILAGVNLAVPAGSVTALVGPSGAGKTTVAKLVARFFDPDRGTVRVCGVDVADMPSQQLMHQIAIVSQDIHLLDDTIKENIRYGNPDATDTQIQEAANRAGVDSIVTRLPDGWDTPVGEGGRSMSGGERQRVAIARAIAKNTPILVLDEATSALDTENEATIASTVMNLGNDRTVLVIAHRLDTLRAAEQIAFLEDGTIVETGSHTELLAAGGRYANFWHQQEKSARWTLPGSESA